MQFRLTTLLWLFALLAAGMGTFGPIAGILATAFVLYGHWAYRKGGAAGCLFAVLVALVLVALLLPAVSNARGAARRMQCYDQMKWLVFAMHNYHDANGHFPPPYTTDVEGQPLHSWRVLLLPYLEEKPLYDAIRLDEPWDSEHNQQFAEQVPYVFRCPGCEACARHYDNPWPLPGAGSTNYFVVVGPGAAFEPGSTRAFADFKDGSSNTALVVEAADRSVNWMAPVDLSTADAITLLTSDDAVRHVQRDEAVFTTSFHIGGGAVGFGDGRVRNIGTLSEENARAVLSPDAGDEFDEEVVWRGGMQTITIILWGHVFSFALFVVLALAPMFYNRRARTGGDVGSADDVAGDAKPP